MPPRSIWNGAIAFGAVTVPIKVYGAVEDHSIRFREVHMTDGAPIAHKLVDPTTGEEVPREEVVKGYEVEPGEWVEVTNDEIKGADQPKRKAVELERFVCDDQIDPVFYDKPYNLGPQAGAERGYALLAAALERTKRAGVGRVVLRTREQVVALRSSGGVLRMHTMHAPDEIVHAKDLDVPKPSKKPSEREVKMAQALVSSLETEFEPERYRDTYRERVLELIRRKAEGKAIEVPEPARPEPTDDLFAALEASVKAVKEAKR